MTLEQAQEEVTKFQFEHDINIWGSAMRRMMRKKHKTSEQELATQILEQWLASL